MIPILNRNPMRRKPAIILFALLLFLSIGGAVFHQHFYKGKRPGYPEIDSFLRNEIASGDWMFSRKEPTRSYFIVKAAWWNKIGFRPKSHYEMDHYQFKNLLTEGSTMIIVWREDGKVVMIQYGGGDPVSKGFKELLCRKFPHLRDPSFDPPP